MTRSRLKTGGIITVTLIVAMTGVLGAQDASPDEKQFWPEVDLYWRLTNHSRLLITAAGNRNRDSVNGEAEFGAHLDVFVPRFHPVLLRRFEHPDDSRTRRITLRFGYWYILSPGSETPSGEHRFHSDATLRWLLPAEVLLSNRHRFEYRLLPETSSFRYRDELKFERDFSVHRILLTPYGSAELFFDASIGKFSRWRYSAGVVVSLSRRIALEPYYTRQITKHPELRLTNAAGLTARFYWH
jgi:hypothetical protein